MLFRSQLTPTNIPPIDSIPPRGPALSAQQKRAHDLAAHKAENTRFGEAISEHGFGGTTTNFTHSTTTTAHTTGDAAANAGGGGGVGGSGGGGGKEGQTHRHGSYEDVDEEAEETERRERKWQGYGEGSGVGG